MKKIILAILLIIVVAGTGIPFFNGIIVKKAVQQTFSNINKMYAEKGYDIEFKISQYDLNYLSSQLEWKIKLGSFKRFFKIDKIIFIDHVSHGFTNIESTTSLEKNRWFNDFVNKRLDGKNPLKIKTQYNYSGNIESRLFLDGFSFKEKNHVIEIMPGQIFTRFDKNMKNILSEITWKGCQVPEKFRLDKLFFQTNMKKISTYIWDGKAFFTVDTIKTENRRESFELTKLKSDWNLDYNKKELLLSIGAGYNMDTMRSRYGNIQNASLKIDVNRINARGYEALIRLYSQIVNNTIKDVAASEKISDIMGQIVAKQKAADRFQIISVCKNIFKKGLEVQISNLKAQLPQGKIKADVLLRLKQDMTFARFIPIMMNPAAALDVFSLKSDVRMPCNLVEDTQMLTTILYPGMQTGLFVKDGDILSHKAETRDGKLFLNEKQVLLN